MNKNSINFLLTLFKKPLLFLFVCYGINFFLQVLHVKYQLQDFITANGLFYFIKIAEFITLYWIFLNFITFISQKITKWATQKNHPLFLVLFPPLKSSLEGAGLLITINILIAELEPYTGVNLFIDKSAKIMLILIVAWIFYKIIASLEKYITHRYIKQNVNISTSRKIQTQIIILKRIITGIIIFVALAAIFLLFDGIKSIGISLLTTAGILSAIGAFASQQSLGRLFAGLQIAFTQPIRLGDTVIIENEFGQVEDITLSFIIIKLWDLRRLILPTDYFINKGILNLTRESSELLGTIFLYVDYTLPIEKLRKKFMRLLNESFYWNKKTGILEITDMKEHSVEVRCLMSADNASQLWTLRCEIREKIMKYIIKHHSAHLPKYRILS